MAVRQASSLASLDQEWRQLAACAGEDPEVFFPENRQKNRAEFDRRVAAAKRLCAACPVRWHCLDQAMTNFEDGIWGGTTAEERRLARRPAALRGLPAPVSTVARRSPRSRRDSAVETARREAVIRADARGERPPPWRAAGGRAGAVAAHGSEAGGERAEEGPRGRVASGFG
jgi:WhiB family redox-sensing transcriptional regulator